MCPCDGDLGPEEARAFLTLDSLLVEIFVSSFPLPGWCPSLQVNGEDLTPAVPADAGPEV